jgi:nitrate/TMAO reductase-like tetraheme cytochrome c subunit
MIAETRWITTAFLVLSFFIGNALAYGVAEHNGPVHDQSARTCAACHQQIYDQWRGSMHANSTALKDPIHEAMYRNVMGDPRQEGVNKNGKYPVCLNCHAPLAAMDKVTKLDSKPEYEEGVTCVVCHTMKEFKGIDGEGGKMQYGIKAYEFSDRLQGPSGRNLGPAGNRFAMTIPPDLRRRQAIDEPAPMGQGEQGGFHPYAMEGNALMMRTTKVCLGCHDRRNNFNKVALCATGPEFKKTDTFNCQQCHMPVNNGYADHSMMGGHSQAMVERAVILSLDIARNDNNIDAVVTLKNTLPHNAPTGAPFRNMYVHISGLDANGKVVWTNYKKHPIKEDPKSMLRLVLLDADGKPVPPPKATQMGKDSRLAPLEERRIDYQLPADNVTMVRAELYYDLLLPPMKDTLMKNVPEALKQPKVVAFAEKTL